MNFNAQMYLPICRYRKDWYFRERDVAYTNRTDTVNDIASGELQDVTEVIELSEGGHWRLATEDIAIEVAQRVGDSGNPIRQELYDWISHHAPHAARGLKVCDKTFWAA